MANAEQLRDTKFRAKHGSPKPPHAEGCNFVLPTADFGLHIYKVDPSILTNVRDYKSDLAGAWIVRGLSPARERLKRSGQ